MTSSKAIDQSKCHPQYALSPTRRHSFNANVMKLLDCVKDDNNPYASHLNPTLCTFITKQSVNCTEAERLQELHKNGKDKCGRYRNNVIVLKIKKMSATIQKRKLPLFNDISVSEETVISTEKKRSKQGMFTKCIGIFKLL